MLIFTQSKHIITANIGSGDNLDKEDLANGYVDYLNAVCYHQNEYELEEYDGGMVLLSKYATEYTDQELACLLVDFFEETGEFQVLEPMERP